MPDGDFVVAWTRIAAAPQTYGVFAQRYDAAGEAQGGELSVNELTTGAPEAVPAVAVDASGGFVVTWTDLFGTAAATACSLGASTPSGAPQGGDFPVNILHDRTAAALHGGRRRRAAASS